MTVFSISIAHMERKNIWTNPYPCGKSYMDHWENTVSAVKGGESVMKAGAENRCGAPDLSLRLTALFRMTFYVLQICLSECCFIFIPSVARNLFRRPSETTAFDMEPVRRGVAGLTPLRTDDAIQSIY